MYIDMDQKDNVDVNTSNLRNLAVIAKKKEDAKRVQMLYD